MRSGALLGVALGLGLGLGLAARAEQLELLSRHETVAEFAGVKDHRCMGMTSLCPDRCGHSGTLATFRIVRYLDYAKLGEYGDPQADQFIVLVQNNLGARLVPEAVLATISALKPGDRVRLDWNHEYVTEAGASSPRRPIVRLEKIAE